MSLLGAVELGGTKIRVARGTPDDGIVASETFPTTGPDEAAARMLAFFQAGPPVAALGVGSFGPIGIDPRGGDYGRFLSTPKPGWAGFDLAGALAMLNLPLALETDVAAAGVGEAKAGALTGLGLGIYVTVGTGIGGALILGGAPVNGAAHAEMGHMMLVRRPDDQAPSFCAYHDSCAEGLASGPAIQRRFGRTLSELDPGGGEHALIAHYLGQLMANLVLVAAPERIVLGGGVGKTPGLVAAVGGEMRQALNGYMRYPALDDPDFLTPPALGDDAGLVGGLWLAARASA